MGYCIGFTPQQNKYDFERDVYKDFLKWKSENDKMREYTHKLALVVEGARQCGKTYVIQKFAVENYENVIYINLYEEKSKETKVFNESFEYADKNRNDNYEKERPEGGFWVRVFNRFTEQLGKQFIESKDTVIIIDEVQENHEIYNAIRTFSRHMHCDFIMSGSFLGIMFMENSKDFKISAGDYQTLEVRSLNYSEYVKAVWTGHEEYANLLNIKQDEMSADELHISDTLKRCYNEYKTIGGYPTVVTRALEQRERGEKRDEEIIESCMEVLELLTEQFLRESMKYFTDRISSEDMMDVLERTAEDILTGKGSLQEVYDMEWTENIRSEHTGKNVKRKEKRICLKWLLNSALLGRCEVMDEHNNRTGKYFFNDLGLLNYISKDMQQRIPDSKLRGTIAENFVYLYLYKMNKGKYKGNKHWIDSKVYAHSFYKGSKKEEDIDFTITLNGQGYNKIALEVKSNHSDDVISAKKALARGDIQFIIKLLPKLGGFYPENRLLVFPIHAIDILPKYIDRIKEEIKKWS